MLPGNGRYVDLDGSTGNAGRITSIALSLTTGSQYTLSFRLAGSQRGDTNTVTYGIDLDGDGTIDISAMQTLVSGAGFSTFTLSPFTVGAATSNARIVFDHAGGDNLGLLLDDVVLDRTPTSTVPEPTSLLLLASGLVATIAARRLKS